MIAFSCVHCGQRMTITDGADGKRAQCPSCNQVVQLPTRPGLRRVGSGSGPLKAVAAPQKAPHETHDPTPAMHEMPTRIEEPVVRVSSEYTSFLAPPQRTDEIGRLGGYRVLGVIGAGGMGVVFRAEDVRLEREVALKAMLPTLAASPTSRERFLREARAAAKLQHDRIVPIYQVDEEQGVPFLAMPLLSGESLETRLTRGPLSVAEVRRIGSELAEGLAVIHERGLVHRDVKPGNVWLEGPEARVKVLDFGLARARGDSQLTREGAIVGSPAFMSPEQATRQPVDARSDLFSLGCVLYVMATGKLPFEADDALATLLAVTTAEPVPPRDHNPAVPEALAGLILTLLAKSPDARPTTAREVMGQLR